MRHGQMSRRARQHLWTRLILSPRVSRGMAATVGGSFKEGHCFCFPCVDLISDAQLLAGMGCSSRGYLDMRAKLST